MSIASKIIPLLLLPFASCKINSDTTAMAVVYNLNDRNYIFCVNDSYYLPIYTEDTNLMNALVPDSNVGTLRECFFFNQLRAAHLVTYPKEGDFLVDGKWLFEVGGEGKGFNQIKDIPNSFLAVDDTEVGRGARVPIWLFGFLY